MNTGTFYRETIPGPIQVEKPVVVVARVHTEITDAIGETAPSYQVAA
jgi:hypothetical protein